MPATPTMIDAEISGTMSIFSALMKMVPTKSNTEYQVTSAMPAVSPARKPAAIASAIALRICQCSGHRSGRYSDDDSELPMPPHREDILFFGRHRSGIRCRSRSKNESAPIAAGSAARAVPAGRIDPAR